MKVKEIIINASTLIGRKDVVEYLESEQSSPSQNTLDTVDTMLSLLNMLVKELANSFIPMITTENCNAVNGKVTYSQLSKSPKEILKAFDTVGVDRLLSVEHTFARVGASNVDVEYSYFPTELEIDDEIGYAERDVTQNTLAYGLLAEYAITQGCFKDAVMWHDRYANGVSEQCKPKNVTVKRRNWL